MQLLLDAESTTFDRRLTDSLNLNELENISLDKKLTPTGVKMNLVMFMLAGYETTSTCLSYCAFILAKYQDEQQKVRDEIDAQFHIESNITPNTDNIKSLEYMDMFIKEVLRVYPIAKTGRHCVIPTNINGIDIPAGVFVRPNVLDIHYDPEIWGPVDPQKFYPPRMSPEIKRNPLAFLGFGQGPRNCIGMKFAMVEMKLALVKLLQRYEIHPTADMPDELELVESIVRTPKHGVKVVLKKREF